MLFSQRKGLAGAKKLAQIDSMDQDLRNGLWNALHASYWQRVNFASGPHNRVTSSNLSRLFTQYWHTLFKQPVDTCPHEFDRALAHVREYFFSSEWYQVYDFLEFTNWSGPDDFTKTFEEICNNVLERESSGYRFVNRQLVPVTSQTEIEALESALALRGPLAPVSDHLSQALSCLSDRQSPDFRNSIKESISAVEAAARILTGDPKATLGAALSLLEAKRALHGALKASLSSLYGYTSDAEGIRHAMLEESTLGAADAKFMLIACTAFVNYLVAKAAELKLTLKDVV